MKLNFNQSCNNRSLSPTQTSFLAPNSLTLDHKTKTMLLQDFCKKFEELVPLALQENYDNAGLIVGNPNMEVNGVLLSLDTTEQVIQEAIDKKINLIVAHHPILFKGIKSLTGKNYIERTLLLAIKNDIAIYAAHTNLDNMANGVNFKIAEKLNLKNTRILAPKDNLLMKLVVFVPVDHTGKLLDALYQAGAGEIGKYSNCSFRVEGKGTFKGNTEANPSIGQRGVYEEVNENRVEVIFPSYLKNQILRGMYSGHVYEEVAYYLSELGNNWQDAGSGMLGELPEALHTQDFLVFLKEKMNVSVIRHTALVKDKIKRIALCGGAGSFLLSTAKAQKADIFITADFKYHEFFDADDKIIIADIGHYESEQYTKDLLLDIISKNFPNFASCLSEVKTNPVNYFY